MSGPGVGFEYPPKPELHPSFCTFPIYSIILPYKTTTQEVVDFYAAQSSAQASIPGVPKLDARRVVHGEQKLTFLKPLPTSSDGREFEIRGKVLGVYDKGKPGTVVETEQVLAEKGTDNVYSRAVGMTFVVGQGNWGGPKGQLPGVAISRGSSSLKLRRRKNRMKGETPR
ncbi:hypothetical protein LTR28_006567 [Elasticomyces elasticus]|nr:hypothetical protein LTR28_006567 [Elasticomyces elasticus]